MKKLKISKFLKKKKKKSIKNFQFHEKIQDSQIFQKKKKISKMAVGLRALGSYFLGCFKKKKKSPIKIFNSLKKFKISKFFKKKKKKVQNFKFLEKFKISKLFQKKKKSSGTESYDSLPRSLVMQHQVNYPPSAFIEAWSMSQTRGIRQVCQCLFNE